MFAAGGTTRQLEEERGTNKRSLSAPGPTHQLSTSGSGVSSFKNIVCQHSTAVRVRTRGGNSRRTERSSSSRSQGRAETPETPLFYSLAGTAELFKLPATPYIEFNKLPTVLHELLHGILGNVVNREEEEGVKAECVRSSNPSSTSKQPDRSTVLAAIITLLLGNNLEWL